MPQGSILIQAVSVRLVESYGASKAIVGECATGLGSSLFDSCDDGLCLLKQVININRSATFLIRHFLKFCYKLITGE